MSENKELKTVKVHWEEVETLGIFKTAHLAVREGDQDIGYYRIWHSPETDNIAFYGSGGQHGVMPPMEHQANPSEFYMMKKIKEDLAAMGYEVRIGDDVISDDMLIGGKPFPVDSEGVY